MNPDWLFVGSWAPFADIRRSKQYRSDYERARREHAFLLRCEGLNNKEINKRVGGLSELYMDEWINECARALSRAMCKTRWSLA